MKANLKKVLSMVLVVALTAGIAITGTMAYLTSEDSDVNVMTLGNVKIEQHEYEREVNTDGYVTNDNGYVLTDFTQAKPLLPAVGTVTGWDKTVVQLDQIGGEGNMQMLDGIENAQDKLVVVENTGLTDAYVRTIIAFEAGEKTVAEWNKLVMTSKHNFWSSEVVDIAEIDGNNYVIVEYVYSEVLEAGAVSRNSLSEVYLMPKATNEDCAALDGNNNGTYDILVFSQAVQADGFANAQTALDTAFGDITTTNHPWVNGVELPATVDDVENLNDALEDNGDLTGDAILTADMTVSADDTESKSGYGATGITVNGGTLDGAGKTLTVNDANGTWDSAINAEAGTIKNVTVNGTFRGIFMGGATGDVYIDNVVIDKVCYTFNSDAGSKDYGVYISNSTLNGWTSFSDVHKEVVFTNCNFGKGTGDYKYAFCRPYNAPTVFENCVFAEGFEFDTPKSSDITFINCYYGETLITAENAATLGYGDTTFFYNGVNGITIK